MSDLSSFSGVIKKLLEDNHTEDPISELDLAVYHLKNVPIDSADAELTKIVNGIKSGRPTARILGYDIVVGTKIVIDDNVLSPGPETKTLIEKTIKLANSLIEPNILDVGTGPGSIAIAIGKNVSSAHLIGIDISPNTIKAATINAKLNSVVVEFRHGDLFGPVNGELFDIIVANPPYVKTSSINLLPDFVRNFAPLVAIDGGEDGLVLHKKILSEAPSFLKPGGSLIIECEDNQDIELIKLFEIYGWETIERYHNRYGKIRGFQLVTKPLTSSS